MDTQLKQVQAPPYEFKLRIQHVAECLLNRWKEDKVMNLQEMTLLVLILGPSQSAMLAQYLESVDENLAEVFKAALVRVTTIKMNETEEQS